MKKVSNSNQGTEKRAVRTETAAYQNHRRRKMALTGCRSSDVLPVEEGKKRVLSFTEAVCGSTRFRYSLKLRHKRFNLFIGFEAPFCLEV